MNKPLSLRWKKPTIRRFGNGSRWRQWLSTCGNYNIGVRLTGDHPRKYVVEIPSSRFDGWDLPPTFDPLSGPEHDGFGTLAEAKLACNENAWLKLEAA